MIHCKEKKQPQESNVQYANKHQVTGAPTDVGWIPKQWSDYVSAFAHATTLMIQYSYLLLFNKSQ
jgi:hypothetical protein